MKLGEKRSSMGRSDDVIWPPMGTTERIMEADEVSGEESPEDRVYIAKVNLAGRRRVELLRR